MNRSDKAPKRRFLLDTSWIIAAVCGWHEQHRNAIESVQERLEAAEELWLAAPAIVEAYSVLTRLPVPHRLTPVDAWTLLARNFQQQGRTAYLTADECWRALKRAKDGKIQGGRTYDFLIICCAEKCGAGAILTLNPTDFEDLAGAMKVVSL